MPNDDEFPKGFAGKLARLPYKVLGDLRYFFSFIFIVAGIFVATVVLTQAVCSYMTTECQTTPECTFLQLNETPVKP